MALSFVIVFVISLFAACSGSTPPLGYGDIEPPHFVQESEFIEYLKKDEGLFGESLYGDIGFYYKPAIVPDIFTFAYICPQNIYIGWNYSCPDALPKYPYFEWTVAENGQQRLEFDIENEGLNRLKDTDYYYSFAQAWDYPGIETICNVRWVVDGYIFRLNIPADYVVKNDKPDTEAIKQYTQLQKIKIGAN